jgi:hypothetical protein
MDEHPFEAPDADLDADPVEDKLFAVAVEARIRAVWG